MSIIVFPFESIQVIFILVYCCLNITINIGVPRIKLFGRHQQKKKWIVKKKLQLNKHVLNFKYLLISNKTNIKTTIKQIQPFFKIIMKITIIKYLQKFLPCLKIIIINKITKNYNLFFKRVTKIMKNSIFLKKLILSLKL